MGHTTFPDAVGEVFQEPAFIKASNDIWDRLVWIFNDSATKDALFGQFNVPKDYVGTANIVYVWTSTATSGVCAWEFDYRAVGGNDAESLDQGTAQEAIDIHDTAPSATDERMEITGALTDGNFVADDTVTFRAYRNGTDITTGDDSMAAAAQLVDLIFEYNDA